MGQKVISPQALQKFRGRGVQVHSADKIQKRHKSSGKQGTKTRINQHNQQSPEKERKARTGRISNRSAVSREPGKR